ncbi:MAG: hypothetical protein ACE5JN_11865 [Candidatus Methylomirabilia bacterium]
MSTPDPPERSFPHLKIDRDGDWYTDGMEITHSGVLANLRGNLRQDAEGYFVQVGPVRVPVEVEDTPVTVIRVEHAGDRLRLTLNDGSDEPLDPATLRYAPGGVPYCRVKGGQFEARLTRAATYQLAQFVQYDEVSDVATLVLAGARYPVKKR